MKKVTMKQYVVTGISETMHKMSVTVCVLDGWLSDERMREAASANGTECAFAVRNGSVWELRRFTPDGERGLNASVALAAASVLTDNAEQSEVTFRTLNGQFAVKNSGGKYEPEVSDMLTPLPTDDLELLIGSAEAHARAAHGFEVVSETGVETDGSDTTGLLAWRIAVSGALLRQAETLASA